MKEGLNMSGVKKIFNKFLEAKPLFSNRDSLTLSFSPENIPHRETYIEGVGRVLAPSLKGGKPSNLFVYGKTGTGKTLVCTHVTEELLKSSKTTNNHIRVTYTNCKLGGSADTEYRVLAGLIKQLGKDVPFTGLPTESLYQEFFKLVDGKQQVLILIIDEIDSLVQKTGDEILYNLTRMNQHLKKSKVSIIGITNDLGFINGIDPRVRSSLGEEEMVFPPYNAIQIQDILKQRANIAFVGGVLERGVIEKCAALAAQEHGDARRALELLRVAGELSERYGEKTITIENVDAAQEKIDSDRVIEIVKAQPKQSQAVLYAIILATERGAEQTNVLRKHIPIIQTHDVWQNYKKICTDHGIKVLTQRRVSDLIAEYDLFGIIITKVVSKGRYGRTRIIELAVDDNIAEKMKNILLDSFH